MSSAMDAVSFGYENFRSGWTRMVHNADLDKRDVNTNHLIYNIHSLRRYFRNHLKTNGMPVEWIEILMGKIDRYEDEYIKNVCNNDLKILGDALKYFRSHEFSRYLQDLQNYNLDEQQKLCILVNMIEVAMADGVLHKIEQKPLREFVVKMGLDEEHYQTLKDVLLIKNHTSVLDKNI